MVLQWISLLTAVIGTAIGSYIDFKTTYIPDKVTYTMIAIGAVTLFFSWPFNDFLLFSGIAVAVFVFGLIMYTLGQLGGGDVKLFTALALLLPSYPRVFSNYFNLTVTVAPYPFLVSIFFIASILGMLFVSSRYIIKLIRDRHKIKNFNRTALTGVVYDVLLLPIFYIWQTFNPNMLFIAIPMLFGGFALAFKKDILEQYVVMKKLVSKLNDDDVIALELMDEKTKKKLGLSTRKTLFEMELKQIKANAKKHNIKQVLVSEYLPVFGPFIFISLVLNLLVGDLFFWILFL